MSASTPLSATSSYYIQQKLPEPVSPIHPLTPTIKQIALTSGIEFSLVGEGRIIQLKKGGGVKFIKGHVFPVNLSSSASVCKDKAATSDVIKKEKIPQIRHRLFLSPTLGEWNPKEGVWTHIHDYGKKHGYQMVCKTKGGGGGRSVFHTKDPRELELTIARIFKNHRDVVISPFKMFKCEYRVVVYKGQVEVILRKSVPRVIGDGVKTLNQLILSFLETLEEKEQKKLVKDIPPDLFLSQEIPAAGKTISLHWKHNGGGATTELVGGAIYHQVKATVDNDRLDPTLATLTELALQTANVLGIALAAVDIAEIVNDPKGKTLRILEVNSAPMLDHKLDKDGEGSGKCEFALYAKVINDLFAPTFCH